MPPRIALSGSENELTLRLHQQELVAQFGVFALREHGLDATLNEACRVAAEGLEARFAKVLQYRAATNDLLVRGGVGWHPGIVGHAVLPAGLESPAGFALHSGQPVLSNELSNEGRFRLPALLAEHGVQSAINVIVGASVADAYGVLEVDSTHRGEFIAPDCAFMQALANVLAAAVERSTSDAERRKNGNFARRVFECSPDCIKILDQHGTLLAMNETGITLMQLDGLAAVVGREWTDLWPDSEQGKVRAAIATALSGQIAHFEGFGPTPAAQQKWWDVLVVPVVDDHVAVEQLVAISRDMTPLKLAGQVKDQLLLEKDLLMQEVHHRVKNNLQLVRTLLQLQGRAASPETRERLDEAAGRIMTIGAVHQRLYEGGSVAEADAGGYLGLLVEDMRAMLVDAFEGRAIELDVEPMSLLAEEVTPLGLVTTELVTNALKYGAGRITVRVSRTSHGLEVMVEDDGPGFPPDFHPAQSRGLGMRLVTALAKGDPAQAVRIDRSVTFGRIVACLALSG